MNDILAPKGTISEMIGTLKHLRAEIEKLRNLRAEFEKMRKELAEARQEIAKIYDEAEMTRLERLWD